MTPPSTPEDEFQPSLIMMAYQFVFFTFYQIIEQVSTDRFIAYKSALTISVLQSWLAFDLVQLCKFALHKHYDLSRLAFYAVILPPAMVVYYIVYRYGPWQEYMRYFKRWPVKKLVVGRLLVLATVVGLWTLVLVLGRY
jgi:hypothetical protein